MVKDLNCSRKVRRMEAKNYLSRLKQQQKADDKVNAKFVEDTVRKSIASVPFLNYVKDKKKEEEK
jgi:hypothetical protein